MKIAITGLANSGKTTIFNALTALNLETTAYATVTAEPHPGVVKVPDARIDRLAEIYSPKKTTHATVEYVDYIGLTKGDTLIIRAGGLIDPALGPEVATRKVDPQTGDMSIHCAGFNTRNLHPQATPCDQDYLRKLAKDTDAEKLEQWYNHHVAQLYRQLNAYDEEGLFIGDGSYLFVPNNENYEGSKRLLFNEHNHPVSKEEAKKMTPAQRDRCQWRRCYRAVFLLHCDRAGERFVIAGLRVIRADHAGRCHEAPAAPPRCRSSIASSLPAPRTPCGRRSSASPAWTCARRRPNGNTFICSDTEGHLFEVNPDGALAWEYINPVTRDGAVKVLGDVLPMTNSVFRAFRYAATHPAFTGRDLSPKGTITERAAQGLDPRPQRRPRGRGGR